MSIFRIYDQKPPSYNSLFSNKKNQNIELNIKTSLNKSNEEKSEEPMNYALLIALREKNNSATAQTNQLQEQQSNNSIPRQLPITSSMNEVDIIDSTFNNHSSVVYITFYCFILTFLSIILVVLQIVLINNHQLWADFGSGIWIALTNFVSIFLCVFTSKLNYYV